MRIRATSTIYDSRQDYVDLIKVLYRLAVCIKPENSPYLSVFIPDPSDKISEFAGRQFWQRVQYSIDRAEQVGRAAMLLHRSLSDSASQRPQFLRFDFKRRFVRRDSRAEREGRTILSRATQRYEKEYWYCLKHYQKAMLQGEEFLNNPIVRDPSDSLLVPGRHGLVPIGIGFHLAHIISFLNQNGIDSTFRADSALSERFLR
jgi:hypothetical protein